MANSADFVEGVSAFLAKRPASFGDVEAPLAHPSPLSTGLRQRSGGWARAFRPRLNRIPPALNHLLAIPLAFFTPQSGGSPNADKIDDLYKITLYAALVIFVLVEGALG